MLSCDYLNKNGLEIVEINFRCKIGEIDIIAKDGDYYVFIEVKYRKNTVHGDPLEAVTYKKQQRIRLASMFYMKNKGYNPEKTNIRYDVIGITGSKITHIKDAF